MKSVLALVLLFAVSTAAFPLWFMSASPALFDKPTLDQNVTIENANLADFPLYAQYAAAAYCNSHADPGAAVACPASALPSRSTCPDIERARASVVAVLQQPSSASAAADIQGFVAHDAVRRLVVVSFRGSDSVHDVLSHLDNTAQAPCRRHLSSKLSRRIGRGCRVHDGLGHAWAALRDQTLKGVAAAVAAAGPKTAVVVTGHSLGGAVATLVAAELRARGTACNLYTFGSPRVGNAVLAAFLSTQGPLPPSPRADRVAHYRVTHFNDALPQVPALDRDYAHTSPEFWLTSPSTIIGAAFQGATVSPASDFRVCTGYTNESCNAARPSPDLSAHLSYFGSVSGCSPRWLEDVIWAANNHIDRW